MESTDVTKFLLTAAMLVLLLTGCASTGPLPEDATKDYKDRLKTLTDGGVRVSISVLSATESLSLYGAALAKKDIQPVWIEVENHDEATYWLLSPGLDPNFFPASEAADAFAPDIDSSTHRKLDQHFQQLAFKNPITPGTTVSGFILSNLDEGVKMVEVDLIATDDLKTFSFFTDVPGFRADFQDKEFEHSAYYAPDEITNYTDDAAFRAALEALPCCVSNKKSTRYGDPLNLVVIGGLEDAFPALVRRGWHPTEATYAGSVKKMFTSVMSGERYRYSPVSPLYLYGRPQELAMQRARNNIHQRNHLRLWLSSMTYHDKPVWVGQISRDIGTRLTIHSPYLTTHKIDPDVDEALLALIEDLAYSQFLYKVGLVKGVGAAPVDEPRRNLTTDPYYTKGFRGVLFFEDHSTSLAEIEILPWEGEAGGFVEQARKGGAQ